jgi:dTDP-4-dehydrorhamnose reductase
MRVFVTGHRGMLGTDLLPALDAAGLTPIGNDGPRVDITREDATLTALKACRPALVINCAAYTAVDKAESESPKAFAVNRDGAAHLARACAAVGAPLVHVSTDYVFDGQASRPYREDDATNPLGVYGRSKCEGEERVRALCERHLIVRTSWLFGAHGHSFVRTIRRLALERDELRVVADQRGCPTWTGDLAAALAALARAALEPGAAWGTYHYRGAGETTWHGFAEAIVAQIARRRGKSPPVRPIDTAAYPTPARRPAYSVMDCARIEQAFDVRPEPWSRGMAAVLDHLEASS